MMEREIILKNHMFYIVSLDLKETYKEYKDWLQDEPDKHLKQNYNKALMKLEKLQSYEQKLVSTFNKLYSNAVNSQFFATV